MRQIKPRIIVTLDEGLISGVYVEGLGVDPRDIQLIKIDYDTEGAEPADGVVQVDDVDCFFTPDDVDEPDEGFMAAVSRAYDRWSVS